MIPITRPQLPPLAEYAALLEQIWESRMLSNFGPFAQDLEALTAGYLGVPTRVVVSGDIGLTLAIASLDLPAGSAALVPSYTFNSTVNAILWNRLRPVFVDIDPDSFNLDPELAEEHGRRTDARLVVATHVFGNPADGERLQTVAEGLGARLVFDAAHAYGARRGPLPVGSFGDAEVFSLSGTKLVTSAEGGLIATKDAELLEQIRLRRGYGFLNDYNSRALGLNGKMSELHAALGLLTLARIDTAVETRERLVERYRSGLEGIAGLGYQRVRPGDRSTFKDFALVFPDVASRDRVESALGEADVQTKRYFRPCHRMDAYREFAEGSLPVTEDLHARVLCVPIFESLGQDQVDEIVDVVRRTMA